MSVNYNYYDICVKNETKKGILAAITQCKALKREVHFKCTYIQ